MRSITIVFALVLLAGNVMAGPADDQERQGREAFEAGKYGDALTHFRSAYSIEPTSLRAAQVAISAAYAVRLEAALPDLWEWVRSKPAGPDELANVQRAYAAAVKRLEQALFVEKTTVNGLKATVKSLEDRLNATGIDKKELERLLDKKP